MPRIAQATVRNRLLASLPPDAFAPLADQLRPVQLDPGQILLAPEQPVDVVDFVEDGIVSMLASLDNGQMQEVGVVGREGLVGLPAVLGGGDSSMVEAMVQAPGAALRLRAGLLEEAMAGGAAVRRVLLRYAQAFHAQVTQTAACNGHHSTEVRLARWLLMVHDRVAADEFTMTHEFMSRMLGASRPGISVAAGILQKAGLIHYVHGRVIVLDRPGLQAASCECYAVVRRHADRLLAPP